MSTSTFINGGIANVSRRDVLKTAHGVQLVPNVAPGD
jgi:hypothetical protein